MLKGVWQRAEKLPRQSLRLRLTLWYGSLLALALGIFSVLILVLSANAIGQSVDDAVRAEAHIAQHDLAGQLSANPPYWPSQLSFAAVDAYQEPGVTIALLDAAGHVRYESEADTVNIRPSNPAVVPAVLAGNEAWYTTTANRERVRVGAFPIHAPSAASLGSVGSVVGVLLVAKALGDVDATLRLLQLLLILVGGLTLIGAGIAAWMLAARVLQPVAQVTATARAIASGTSGRSPAGDLSRRVPRPGGNDELARLVDTFNEMLAALERLMVSQQRFVADASHELRAPLTTVQGNLAILQRNEDDLEPEERANMLRDAYMETLRLAQLVEDLLVLARQESQRAGGQGSAIVGERQAGLPQWDSGHVAELDRVVLQLVRQLRGRLRADDSPVTLDVGHIEPVRVRADEEAVRRVALILLDNAIKYTPAAADGPTVEPPHISVSVERVGKDAVLRVRDSGIGIAAADLPHVFERFYRADRARDRSGSGLGLAIAAALVERLGGRIEVESELGRGSTFSIYLPLAERDVPPKEDEQ
ncbi:MAG TPA: HAMP domain-containing sensor histidine kinase [Ktedonobacterales bacterium]